MVLALSVFLLAAEFVHAAFTVGPSWLFDDVLYDLVDAIAAALCIARGLARAEDRAAWLTLGAGITAWTLGDVLWSVALGDNTASPNVADIAYLAFYPCALAALILFARRHVRVRNWAVRLDGVIAGLGLAALATAVLLGPALAVGGSSSEVATNLAYVIEDVVLIGFVGAMTITGGRRTGAPWVLLAAGLFVSVVADAVYLLQSANGSYVEGGVLDTCWLASLVLMAWAAWHPVAGGEAEVSEDWRSRLLPMTFGAGAIGILVIDHLDGVPTVAMALAAATSAAVLARLMLTAHETDLLLRLTRHEAVTDPLTGMANRRALLADLERACQGRDGASSALIVFDLNGFKHYNDSFGHPSGDALLIRLGHRLRDAEHGGRAYRLGGDEFCLLAASEDRGTPSVVARALAALTEHGEGFSITSSHGFVQIPGETADPGEAMRIADRRMYAQKHSRQRGEDHIREALLRTVEEGHPDLHVHQDNVAALARATARGLGMSAEEIDVTVRAAEMHDIGKIAIPDQILSKPTRLTDEEFEFIRRHTIVGERILSASPALAPVARIVRASHERWDGDGYPDGIAGDAIPLGARIVAVCDAFDVMTTERPYKTPLSPSDAISEILRCAGKQFDRRVVEAFCRHATAVYHGWLTAEPGQSSPNVGPAARNSSTR